jgi:glycosyltransferase involved in cell wall biosynthesis
MQPLVSIVVPTHNRPDWLAEALASIRAQTFTDYEVIVVSNGENGDMRKKSQAAAAIHKCWYFALDQGNVAVARNFGVKRARGEWIAFLDDDDIWLPNKLERQLAEARCTGADMISCDYVLFYPDGREFLHEPRVPDGWSLTKAVSHHYWWTIPSVTVLRKRVLAEVGGFDPRFICSEDMDLWRRISWRYKIHHMEEPLLRYRAGHINTNHPQNARRRLGWDLRHYVKMHHDTPRHLRSALPSFTTFALPRLVDICSLSVPKWLRRLKPRTRLMQLRYQLTAHARSRAVLVARPPLARGDGANDHAPAAPRQPLR